ncbi:MAG TPA: amidase [Solirubrobacteraceae bacterium]|jgi:aspartyl-tRNA(Asn)/glutamyl-tRNA(Gln) amidotransferase subunit A|nr:amidase [Solirubrobacteraceae bacterium]
MAGIPLTLVDTAAALRSRAVTSVELVEEAIMRADALDERLGVYITRLDDSARAGAARADADFAAGIDRGPLQGVPIGVKDILAASEGPTTGQSLVLDPAWGEGRDAIAVERLKGAGAVITGKLSTMEFACGLPDPAKPFPLPRNPWDLETWPGGSSSGTGAGVAAGLFTAGLGTDTGGSIRIPAIYCGVSGLMPTFGRVPNAGCVPLGYSLDHIGPLARSARDCAVVLAAIAGPDPRDPYAADVIPFTAPVDLDGSLTGLRIGLEREHHLGVEGEDPAVPGAFEAAATVLGELGATVVEVALPHYAEVMVAALVTCMAESLAYHAADLRERPQDFARSNRSMLPLGACFSGADYVQSQRVRRVAQRALASVFADVDVIAMPAASRVAPRYDHLLEASTLEVLAGIHTMYWDAVGNPALVVPMGFNADGLPLSLQLAARPFEEELLVRAGDAYQRATNWHLQVPALARDLSVTA